MLTCEDPQCGKNFLRASRQISAHNYCSHSCAARVNNYKFRKRDGVLQKCVNQECTKYFKKWMQRSYCSKECYLTVKRAKYNIEFLLEKIRLSARKLSRTPAKREMQNIERRCIKVFGSWNNALVAAGLTPHRSHSQRMYRRMNTKAKDGHICDSISEALIDNWLADHSIAHARNTPYPTTRHKAD